MLSQKLFYSHGTHTAALAVGEKYGLATKAKIVAVKVLNDAGTGWLSDVISGVEWASCRRARTRKPSIANLSLAAPVSPTLDAVVANVRHCILCLNQQQC